MLSRRVTDRDYERLIAELELIGQEDAPRNLGRHLLLGDRRTRRVPLLAERDRRAAWVV
jgi:hypothetical protein